MHIKKNTRPYRAAHLLLRTLLAAAVGMTLLAYTAAEDQPAPKEETTLSGRVTAARWDENGTVTGVTLFDGEEDTWIADEGPGHDLLNLLDRRVSATGVFGTNPEGERVFIIRTYKVMEDPAPSEGSAPPPNPSRHRHPLKPPVPTPKPSGGTR